jgi:signal transduction histidine kinase
MMAGEFARRAAEAAERLPAPLGYELLATPEYPSELGISYLLMVPVRAPAFPAAGARTRRDREDYGRILAGFASDPPERDLLACLCLAQKLATLAQGAELAEEIQLRDQFLSIASHELKTPLTSIYGVLQLQERMLRKEGGADRLQDRQASYLRMVIRQTQRLNELIDGLLDVSRIQNGRFLAEPADTDVAALVRETMSGRLAVIAQETGVRLNLDAPEALRAWVDPVRMEEVLTNLVMNAIRFSPEGGTVWVRLRSDGERLHLTVRDQGPSVQAEDRERIFRPFERVQRTARFGGLGLGLFISRQIAQLHGGDVFLAESLPGKGNVFEAVFPLRASQKSA